MIDDSRTRILNVQSWDPLHQRLKIKGWSGLNPCSLARDKNFFEDEISLPYAAINRTQKEGG